MALTRLREAIAGLEPPEGPDGFEGLVATAAAAVTGFALRLARSGAQFGRDIAGGAPDLRISIECKRYKDKLSLAALLGKAAQISLDVHGTTDVWILAATIEVGANERDLLQRFLDDCGISLLMLDWTASGLPPLAVLLAMAREQVLGWIEARSDQATLQTVAEGLDEVAADPLYPDARATLLAQLRDGQIGLDALWTANRQWGEARFGSRREAQRAFNQYLAPADPAAPAVDRPRPREQLAAAIAAAPAGGLVTLLGDWGSGKSWLAAQWWMGAVQPPILVVAAGQRLRRLDPDQGGLRMIAELLAHQSGQVPEAVALWERKLRRWARATVPGIRFVVLLDGLNEVSGPPWVAILRELRDALAALGGVVLVTCRREYWRREIARRGIVASAEIEVGDFDVAELDAFLAAHARSGVSPRVRAFLAKPRIAGLAIGLLDQLPDEESLTLERLLLEHTRARLIERGDLAGHDDRDFANLLRTHAAEFRARASARFDRDEWQARSGAVKRGDRDYRHDLNEIEEGPFFAPSERPGHYEFRPEALPLAMGLLLADRVRDSVEASEDAVEAIAAEMDDIRAFDPVARVFAAAICVALSEKDYPRAGVAALIHAGLQLQNRDEDITAEMLAWLPEAPDAYLDAWELPDESGHVAVLFDRVMECRDVPAVRDAVHARIPRWLGAWSRRSGWQDETFREGRLARIEAELPALSAAERTYLDTLCIELESPPGFAGGAIRFLAGQPLAPYARAFAGFALVSVFADDVGAPHDRIAPLTRLNRLDHPAFADALRREADAFLAAADTELMRRAAAYLLRLTGCVADARRAEQLAPRELGRRWTSVERFCDVDPLDPNAPQPSNLDKATPQLLKGVPQEVWTSMSRTAIDHALEEVTPALARFDPEPLIARLRAIIATGPVRTGLHLRQLAWHLPDLSPLFGREEIAAVSQTLDRAISDAELGRDRGWIIAIIVEALLPHLGAPEQLALLRDLPDEVHSYTRLERFFRPLATAEAETALLVADQAGPVALRRVLFFLGADPPPLTPAMRAVVRRALMSDDDLLATHAAHFAWSADDDELATGLAELIGEEAQRGETHELRQSYREAALANALVRSGDLEGLHAVGWEQLGFVASRLGGAAADALADRVEDTLTALLGAAPVAPPEDAALFLDVEDEAPALFRIEDGQETTGPLPPTIENLERVLGGTDDWDARRSLLTKQAGDFFTALALSEAAAVAWGPLLTGLDAVIAAHLERAQGWAERILACDQPAALRRVHNLALPLARALDAANPELARALLRHVWPQQGYVNVVVGRARLPLRHAMLFGLADTAGTRLLWREVLLAAESDGEIAVVALAAEAQGRTAWLDECVETLTRSALPADIALGLTLAGLRDVNSLSETVLAEDWGPDFLGGVAGVAATDYRRNSWTRTWIERALAANTWVDWWRSGLLAAESADARALIWSDAAAIARHQRDRGGELETRLRKRAEKVGKERSARLFGARKLK